MHLTLSDSEFVNQNKIRMTFMDGKFPVIVDQQQEVIQPTHPNCYESK